MSLSDYLPSGQNNVPVLMYIRGFFGCALGIVLYPLFLPVPGRIGTLSPCIIFIALLLGSMIIIELLGADFWLKNQAVMIFRAIVIGMFYPLCYGAFFLAQNTRTVYSANPGKTSPNRKFAVFPKAPLSLAVVMVSAILIRNSAPSILEHLGLLTDQHGSMLFLFNAINVLKSAGLIFCCLTFIFLHKQGMYSDAAKTKDMTMPLRHSAAAGNTDWTGIFALTGISVLFNILNAAMNMKLFPFVSFTGVSSPYSPQILIVSAAVILCGFLAGINLAVFMRYFLGFSIILFCMFPCLLFLEQYPLFISVFSTFISVFRFTVWVVFTVAVVERYHGSFWFYGIAAAIYFTNGFSFLGTLIAETISPRMEFIVLLMGLLAASLVFLTFRVLLHKPVKSDETQAVPGTHIAVSQPDILQDFEDYYRQHGLTNREKEIADLMVLHGLDNNDIAERLFITPITVKEHISNIYRKFKVHKRHEFMALFLKLELENNGSSALSGK